MTVAELIEILKKQDQDRVVYFEDDEYGPGRIADVKTDSVLLTYFKDLDGDKVIFLTL